MSKNVAFAYFRTSSRTNIGSGKDSEPRQREAVLAYAKANRISIEAEFYDKAVSGADPIDERPQFAALLERCKTDGINIVLVENASRFARDLAIQLTGHKLMQKLGIELVPVDAPTYFTDPTPTAVMVSQILGAVAQFDKTSLVLKLRSARERVRRDRGHCEGRYKPVPVATLGLAKKLARKSPKTGERLSYRKIAAELAKRDHVQPSTGKPYAAYSVQCMLEVKKNVKRLANAKSMDAVGD